MVDTLDDIITDLQSYVVAPLNAFGLGGFVFDSQGESIAHLSSEITDHYTEDNKAVQDHVAIRPIKITLKGYVGEVVYSTQSQSSQFLQQAVKKLTSISAFLPELSASATQLQETIQAPSQSNVTLADAANIYGDVKNLLASSGFGSKQQNAFSFFKALMNEKVLLGVQTPWQFLTNMMIETIVAIQDENSLFITDFSVTLKQMRFAQTLTTAYSAAQSLDGDAAIQGQNLVNIGNVPGVSLPSNQLPALQSLMTGAHSLSTIPGLESLFRLN